MKNDLFIQRCLRIKDLDAVRDGPKPPLPKPPFPMLALFLLYCYLFQMAKPKNPRPTTIMLKKTKFKNKNSYTGILKFPRSNQLPLELFCELIDANAT